MSKAEMIVNLKQEAFFLDEYDMYPNITGMSLSVGEIKDFAVFGRWMSTKVSELQPKGKRLWEGVWRREQQTIPVTVLDVFDPTSAYIHAPQITIHDLLQTTYTLTGQGLRKEVLFPGETVPIVRIIRNRDTSRILKDIQQHLH